MPSYPGLYQLHDLSNDPEFTCKVSFDIGHPILKGHFPGHPVVPGAWLIRVVHDAVEQALDNKLNMQEASQVKFLKPVLPRENQVIEMQGEILREETGKIKVNATLHHAGTVFMKLKACYIAVKS